MAEVTTLLAHLVPKLTSRVEDAATDALAFILNSSAGCRGALDCLLQDGDFNPQPIDRVETQVTYQDGSRPDMVGYDRSGAKRVARGGKIPGQPPGESGQSLFWETGCDRAEGAVVYCPGQPD